MKVKADATLTITIWYVQKHDNFTTFDFPADPKIGIVREAARIRQDGGFFDGSGWVPWHRINYITKAER